MLLALIFYPVCYFIAMLIRYGNMQRPLYCWPSPDPLPYMTPGASLFFEWWHADGACAPYSQLRKTFRGIQNYLWILFPFVISYLIACAIIALIVKKKGQKKGQLSHSLSIIILIFLILDLFVLLIWPSFGFY
jgi:hypothetical protein